MTLYIQGSDKIHRIEGNPAEQAHLIKPDHVHDLVTWVRADGNHLKRIEERCPGLPMVRMSFDTTWFGDHAKFIVGNMKYIFG